MLIPSLLTPPPHFKILLVQKFNYERFFNAMFCNLLQIGSADGIIFSLRTLDVNYSVFRIKGRAFLIILIPFFDT